MANKIDNKNSTQRRKRYSRSGRLQNAKKWAEQNNGKNVAKGYSKWFGVDLLCAITELEMLGYQFKQSYIEQVKQSRKAKQIQKEKRKRENAKMEEDFGDETFYFIAGYTENGVPFGLTWGEMEEDDKNIYLDKSTVIHSIDNEGLPF
jgi:ribosomal protein L9